MLKRIAVVTKNDKLVKTAKAIVPADEFEILPVAPDGDAPDLCAAVLSAKDLEDGIGVASKIGCKHETLLNLLAQAIDCRESFTLGSSQLVQEHATRFAQALGLSAGDQWLLEAAALLRDVGKLRIPNHVLLKDGVLTYDEWMQIQCHPKAGAELLEEMGIFSDIAPIVHRHHECYDGDGYPDGLEGDAIPYLARAMRILDVYCAMTSPRHYRKGHATHQQAVEHLKNERGKHFDPKLVDVFIKKDVGKAK